MKATDRVDALLSDLKVSHSFKNLEFESAIETPAGTHYRFQQKHLGQTIKGAGMSITVSNENDMIAFQNHTETQILNDADSADFSVSEDQALQLAYEETKLTASPTVQKVEKKFEKISEELRPVYEIEFSAPIDHKWSWKVEVDGDSGKIINSASTSFDEQPDLPAFVKVPVTVFDPNPTIRSGHAYGTVPGYLDNNNSNSDFFDSQFQHTSVETTQVNGKYVLKSKYAMITDQEAPKNPDCTLDQGATTKRRADQCFDSINVLYHLTKSLRYLNETLHINAHPLKYAGPVHADPNGVDGDDNSHFLQITDELAYGQGGIHDAQDHDVVLHELGHAIHSWVTHGHISNIEGLSEGVGDYWAASYSRTKMKKNNVAYTWVYSYDGHNPYWPGRMTTSQLKYPEGAQGEIHLAGSLFTSACMATWEKIGKIQMDRIFWSGIAMLDETSNQQDAVRAIAAAAKAIYPKSPILQKTVADTFKSYGYSL